jgi:hypothetical protein
LRFKFYPLVTGTDVPFDFALPSTSSVSKASVEEIREWVLAASMDQSIDTTKGQYDANLKDPATGKMRTACIVTVSPLVILSFLERS